MDEFLQQEEEKAKELEEFRQIREMQDREHALSLAADREKDKQRTKEADADCNDKNSPRHQQERCKEHEEIRQTFKQLLPVEPAAGSYERIQVKVKMPDSSECCRNFHGQDNLQAVLM